MIATRRALLGAAGTGLLAAHARAQGWRPSRPIRLMVAAGSAADSVARNRLD